MRQVSPSSLRPPTLKATGKGGQKASKHVATKRRNASAALTFPDHWNMPDVRGVLYARHGKSCAYCGCHLPRNDRGDVEHFRPKTSVYEDESHGGYWWLAYDLQNYLLSCRICNSSRKSNRFPLRSRASRRALFGGIQLPQEARLLLNPATDAVEDLLQVELREGRCRIAPRAGLSRQLREQIDGTIQFFKLNIDPKLVQERTRVWTAVDLALTEGRENDARLASIRFCQHSLAARQLLQLRDASLLPSASTELRWFLNELLDDLEFVLDSIDLAPDDELLKDQRDELLWTMAALWKEPMVGTPLDVEARLDEFGLKSRVQPYFTQL